MIFEFLIAYYRAENTEIVGVVRDCLAKVLEDNLNDFDKEAVEQMVIPRLERLQYQVPGSRLNHQRVEHLFQTILYRVFNQAL